MEQPRDSSSESLDREKFVELLSVFPPQNRGEFLQLINGLRPVAEVFVIEKRKDIILPAIESLKGMGFCIAQKELPGGSCEYYVSKKQELADEAATDSVDQRRFGELMGFPQVSIDAFMGENGATTLSRTELSNIIGFENYCFGFAISRETTKDELDYLKKSYRILLEQAPEILDPLLPEDVDKEDFKKKVMKFVYDQEEAP